MLAFLFTLLFYVTAPHLSGARLGRTLHHLQANSYQMPCLLTLPSATLIEAARMVTADRLMLSKPDFSIARFNAML